MKPKGKLLIIGGAEDKGERPPDIIDQMKEFIRYEILTELLKNSQEKKIELVTTGSIMQEEVRIIYQAAFHAMGYENIGFIAINDRVEARKKVYLKRVEEAGAIFFTGGDQFRLATILGASPFVNFIKTRYEEDSNFVVAGTSAGAMIMSSVMIGGGGLKEALIYRNLNTSSGLGFLPSCIIDTHFIKRGRFSRLAHAIIMNPEQLGIGLGEDTALIIKNGTDAECRGSGMVVVIDGNYIRKTNITTVKQGEPVYVENLKVHLLVKGCCFSLEERKMLEPVDETQFKDEL